VLQARDRWMSEFDLVRAAAHLKSAAGLPERSAV
jgi:hypothetical protein